MFFIRNLPHMTATVLKYKSASICLWQKPECAIAKKHVVPKMPFCLLNRHANFRNARNAFLVKSGKCDHTIVWYVHKFFQSSLDLSTCEQLNNVLLVKFNWLSTALNWIITHILRCRHIPNLSLSWVSTSRILWSICEEVKV